MDAEDVDVGVLGDAFLDVGVELESEFFALFGGLGHMHHFGALGFGHRERVVFVLVAGRKLFNLYIILSLALELFDRAEWVPRFRGRKP